MEAHFADESVLKITLLDERLEMTTRYGKLLIPVAEVRQIDFATRVPEDVAKRIPPAIEQLGSTDFAKREAAMADLRKAGAAAYPALLKAAKSTDPEVARRADELLGELRQAIPEEKLEVREHDIVQTEEMKIVGRLSPLALKVNTKQFGDQQVKLSDLTSIRLPGHESDDAAKDVLEGQNALNNIIFQVGMTFNVRVTGQARGTIYGTDIYTGDSSLPAAAVHAGVLKPGKTGVVRVKIVGPQPGFVATTRNGVTSNAYGAYGSAYQILKGRR